MVDREPEIGNVESPAAAKAANLSAIASSGVSVIGGCSPSAAGEPVRPVRATRRRGRGKYTGTELCHHRPFAESVELARDARFATLFGHDGLVETNPSPRWRIVGATGRTCAEPPQHWYPHRTSPASVRGGSQAAAEWGAVSASASEPLFPPIDGVVVLTQIGRGRAGQSVHPSPSPNDRRDLTNA